MALFQISTQDCSCHFKDGMRDNGPTLFKRNEQKAMQYSSPEKRYVLVMRSCLIT